MTTRHRVDPNQARLERTAWLPRPIDEIFAFFADAANLERITPPELLFRIVTPQPIAMHTGTLIDYRLGLFGIPFRWRTEITDWSPPHPFVDTQLAGPYRQWIHTHEFQAERGGTRMLDRVEYVLPRVPLGSLAASLIRRELARIFDYREATIQRLLA